jgi:putative endonuclease
MLRIVMLMPLPFCVYVLLSKKDLMLYLGMTGNLESRLAQHNGENTSTRYRRPLELIYCEFFILKEDALCREHYFKTTHGKRALKIMLTNTLKQMGYKATEVKY